MADFQLIASRLMGQHRSKGKVRRADPPSSLRAKRSDPDPAPNGWIASSLRSSQ
jgi:hypothetical protein